MRPYRRRVSSKFARPVLGEWRERIYPAESTTDWIGASRISPGPVTKSLKPNHGDEIHATTPEFQWPDLGATHAYTIQIQSIGGAVLHTAVTPVGENYYLLPLASALPVATEYQWIVKSNTVNTWSAARRFYVRKDAVGFQIDVPGAGAGLGDRLYDHLVSKAHPRYLDSALLPELKMALNRDDPRNPGIAYWEANISWMSAYTTNEEAYGSPTVLYNYYRFLYTALMYWRMVGNTTKGLIARDFAKRITVEFITPWDGTIGFKRGFGTVNSVDQTNAKTEYVVDDGRNQSARLYMYVVALGMDAFKPGNGTGTDLTTAQYNTGLAAMDYRFKQARDSLIGLRRMQVRQYESHAVNDMGFITFAAALICDSSYGAFVSAYGLETNVQDFVKIGLPLWLRQMPTFRNDDGSTNRSSAYDEADSSTNTSLLALHIFGIELQTKPKLANAVNWRAYMFGVPGIRPHGQFGDEAQEVKPGIISYGVQAFRNPSAFNSDHYSVLPDVDLYEDMLTFAPRARSLPPAQKQNLLSTVFQLGGYYASLASASDPDATAVYMRSSPYGGFSHAHHDMNHFVMWVKNKMLLHDSGYYQIVGFGPPHFMKWARTSRAHNTLTLDYGAGQQSGANGNIEIDRQANGRLICWAEAAEYSYTLGEGGTAYLEAGYTLETFQRALVHFRDDVVICIDYAKAPVAHVFDWNFHTQTAVAYSGGVFTITDGDAKAYIKQEYCSLGSAAPVNFTGSDPNSVARSGAAYNYNGWDGPLAWSGTVSSATANSITVTGANWNTNPQEWDGAWITVGGVERKVESHTANTFTLAAKSGAPVPSGAFTVAPLWAPGPPTSFPDAKRQFHHRICTATAGTEYKAVTVISANTTGQVTNTSTAALGNTIAFTFTFRGRVRTVALDFVTKTVNVT